MQGRRCRSTPITADQLSGGAPVPAENLVRAGQAACSHAAKVEGLRGKLKRLTERGWLTENEPGMWPIATGVIEGTARHLVGDRLEITGARWGLAGAEAILKLRAVISNGDLDAYWPYHLAQEHCRVHPTRYQDGYALTA